jgi:CxxC-x17-CxxC domain-containing protein
MGDFKRGRTSGTRGARFDRGDSDRDGGRGFGRSTSKFGSRGGGRSFGGRDSDRGFDRGRGKSRADYEMHKVICDKCGKECEVPFKPTSSKPVYCSDCFKSSDSPRRDSGNRPTPSTADFDQINEKLNKIMKALNIE